MKNFKTLSLLFLLFIFSFACGPEKKNETPATVKTPEKPPIPTLEYSVVSTLPHDTTSFTEGLLFHDNQLFESTGSPQGSHFKSVLGIVDPKTGKIDVKAEIDGKTYFGEGLVFLKNKIYQVTLLNQLGFIYDAKTYKKIGEFTYSNKEGWGMTTDGTSIIMSDGTDVLSYFDQDFKPVKTISVKENGYAKDSINELEYINGFIYGNIWMTGNIVKIDPSTGNIVARINLKPLYYETTNLNPSSLEMNGIAYNPVDDKIYITGKAWPKIYEVKFQH